MTEDSCKMISEIVVKAIIDKLINLTIGESFKNDINEMIPSHCFEKIKEQMNHMVHEMFIFQDRDDKMETTTMRRPSTESINILKEEIFYDNMYHGSNEWTEILEPVKIHFYF